MKVFKAKILLRYHQKYNDIKSFDTLVIISIHPQSLESLIPQAHAPSIEFFPSYEKQTGLSVDDDISDP
jgi:hypothetical protein